MLHVKKALLVGHNRNTMKLQKILASHNLPDNSYIRYETDNIIPDSSDQRRRKQMITSLCIFLAFSGAVGTVMTFLMREPKFFKYLSIAWTSFWIAMTIYCLVK